MKQYLLSFAVVSLCIGGLTLATAQNCDNIGYAKICQLFRTRDALSLETTIELSNCDTDTIRSSKEQMSSMIKTIAGYLEMRSFSQPLIMYHSDDSSTAGYGFALLTENGLLSGRFFNRTNQGTITISSHKPYNPTTLAPQVKQLFGACTCATSIKAIMPST